MPTASLSAPPTTVQNGDAMEAGPLPRKQSTRRAQDASSSAIQSPDAVQECQSMAYESGRCSKSRRHQAEND